MASLTFKSVTEMSFEEMEARAKPITERAKKLAWDNDLPIWDKLKKGRKSNATLL